MPSSQPCQVCRRHRSQWRRTCLDCGLRVAPGCVPERCLAEDLGDYTGVCRPCAVRWNDRRITATRLQPPALLQEVLHGELRKAHLRFHCVKVSVHVSRIADTPRARRAAENTLAVRVLPGPCAGSRSRDGPCNGSRRYLAQWRAV